MNKDNINYRKRELEISAIEITSDRLTGRAGLALFVAYLYQIQIFPIIDLKILPCRIFLNAAGKRFYCSKHSMTYCYFVKSNGEVFLKSERFAYVSLKISAAVYSKLIFQSHSAIFLDFLSHLWIVLSSNYKIAQIRL